MNKSKNKTTYYEHNGMSISVWTTMLRLSTDCIISCYILFTYLYSALN